MKIFKYLIFCFACFACLNLDVNALMPLCIYQASDGELADISIDFVDDIPDVYFSTEKTTAYEIDDNLIQMMGDLWNQKYYLGMCGTSGCGSRYRFSQKFDKLYSVTDTLDNEGVVYDINHFGNDLFCSKYIIFGMFKSGSSDGVKPHLFLYNNEEELSDEFWDSYEDQNEESKYPLKKFELLSKYSYFRPDMAIYTFDFDNCNTNVDDLISFFDLDGNGKGWFHNLTEAEKSYIAKVYDSLDVDVPANVLLEKYSEGGTCYNQFPDSQDKFKDLVDSINVYFSYGQSSQNQEINSCNAIIGDPDNVGSFAYYLRIIFKIMCYSATVLLVVLTIYDYSKYLFSGDGDALSKCNKRAIKRIIFAVLIFMLPTLVNSLMYLFGFYDKCVLI